MGRKPGAQGWFADEVRRFRLKMGWSQAELAKRVFLSEQQIGHFETGYRTPAKKEDCAALDHAFGLDGHFEGMFDLIKDDEEPNILWKLLRAEEDTIEMRLYETQVIPGLLQIEAYIRALSCAGFGKRPVDERVAARLDRQKVLSRDDPPWLWVVMDYPALRRNIGGAMVMQEQYKHLLAVAEHPKVTIQLIPEQTSMHAGLDGAFHVLTLRDRSDVAWSDSAGAGRFFEQPEFVADFRIRFDLISSSALPAEASVDLIKSLLE